METSEEPIFTKPVTQNNRKGMINYMKKYPYRTFIVVLLLVDILLVMLLCARIAHGALNLKMNLPYTTYIQSSGDVPIYATNTPKVIPHAVTVALSAPEVARISPVVVSEPVQVTSTQESEYTPIVEGWECRKIESH